MSTSGQSSQRPQLLQAAAAAFQQPAGRYKILFTLGMFLIILLLSQINEKFIKLFSILGIGICLILMAVTL